MVVGDVQSGNSNYNAESRTIDCGYKMIIVMDLQQILELKHKLRLMDNLISTSDPRKGRMYML